MKILEFITNFKFYGFYGKYECVFENVYDLYFLMFANDAKYFFIMFSLHNFWISQKKINYLPIQNSLKPIFSRSSNTMGNMKSAIRCIKTP